jgi:hypothetical protein
MQNAEIYPTERNGKKLQIRGFPTKWTEDMTHEDISVGHNPQFIIHIFI